jgi:hypothetical protein
MNVIANLVSKRTGIEFKDDRCKNAVFCKDLNSVRVLGTDVFAIELIFGEQKYVCAYEDEEVGLASLEEIVLHASDDETFDLRGVLQLMRYAEFDAMISQILVSHDRYAKMDLDAFLEGSKEALTDDDFQYSE